MSVRPLPPADHPHLAARGIDPAEAERQLALLRDPPPPTRLEGPCRVGDGIARLKEAEALEEVWREAAAGSGRRLVKFVPASGAASRMFADLERALESGGELRFEELRRRAQAGDEAALPVARFLENLERFAFYPDLAAALAAEGATPREILAGGDCRRILVALLAPERMGYAGLPKAVLPFHRYDGDVRTPLDEHFVEGAGYLGVGKVHRRLHLTVSPEHEDLVAAHAREAAARWQERLEVPFEVVLSVQSPATDTLAITPDGELFRAEGDEPLLRPGGHGALLGNLARLDADVVFVKNIDNVVPEGRQALVVRWKRRLAGRLLELRRRIFEALESLDRAGDEGALEAGLGILSELSLKPPEDLAGESAGARRRYLRERLDRPLRVCGVVPNTGEPGGGPFWVREEDGTLSAQIVESAQIAPDSEQQARWRSSTHFNPVDLVCGLTDSRGGRYDLARFVDPRAVFISSKTHGGRALRALEHPGLWNGGMAGWNTLFVEVPRETFAPVKTVLDLLRTEHRA